MKILLSILFSLIALGASAQSSITVNTEPPQYVAPLNDWRSTDAFMGRAQFYKDVNGTVHLERGVHKWFGPAVGQLVFVLPAGYRPAQTLWFPLATGFGYGSLEIRSTGEAFVTASFGPDNYFTWVSLSGVTFRAAP